MGAGRLILYGAGQLGIMLLARFFFQWVIRFADVGKDTASGPLFAAATVGGLFFAFRIFDGVTDPLAGRLSDFWVRTGRQRRSLIWLSFLVPPVGLALVFSPTAEMDPGLRWTLLTGGMFFFFVGYTLYAIPYWSLLEDYSQGDKKVRTSLSNMLGLGVLLATGIGFVVSPDLVKQRGFLSGALIFAGVGTVLMTLPYFAAPRGGGKPAATEQLPPLRETLLASFKHKRFVAVIILFAGAQMSLTVMTSAAAYIAEDILSGTIADVKLLLGPFLVAAVPTFAIVPLTARKFGWEKATVVGTIALSIAYMGAGLLGQGYLGLGPWATAMIVFACAGPGAAFVLALEGEAIAQCAEESDFKSTGIYFGVYNFIVKALNGLALFFTGILAEMDTLGAVRAMPICAGILCVLGVLAYGTMKERPAKN